MADDPDEGLPRTAADLDTADDCVIAQGWKHYSDLDHAIWRRLFERQSKLLPGRACAEYLAGLEGLGVAAGEIPDFERLSDILERATGWRIVAVPGLVPDDVFFAHLAARRFPATNWIRRPEQMDYLWEPDIFHDIFGHVPVLMNPAFADYMAAYGRGGLKALALGALPNLARLYWYTVEFGLMRTAEGLRIYGSAIAVALSSPLRAYTQPLHLFPDSGGHGSRLLKMPRHDLAVHHGWRHVFLAWLNNILRGKLGIYFGSTMVIHWRKQPVHPIYGHLYRLRNLKISQIDVSDFDTNATRHIGGNAGRHSNSTDNQHLLIMSMVFRPLNAWFPPLLHSHR